MDKLIEVATTGLTLYIGLVAVSVVVAAVGIVAIIIGMNKK